MSRRVLNPNKNRQNTYIIIMINNSDLPNLNVFGFFFFNIIYLISQEVLSILFQLFDKDNEKVLKQEQWIQSLKERLL